MGVGVVEVEVGTGVGGVLLLGLGCWFDRARSSSVNWLPKSHHAPPGKGFTFRTNRQVSENERKKKTQQEAEQMRRGVIRLSM